MKTITLLGDGTNERYQFVLKTILGDTAGKSMIDLCCCHAPMTKGLLFSKKVFVDVVKFDIPNEEFVLADVLGNDPIFQQKFDVAFALDAIEHFVEEDGRRFLTRMESISGKQVLFTPLGDYGIQRGSHDPKAHKSGWVPEMLPGYDSIVFPKWHPTLGIGAFFFWKVNVGMEEESARVELMLKGDEARSLFR